MRCPFVGPKVAKQTQRLTFDHHNSRRTLPFFTS
jgi:hypothetical protein